MPRPSVDEPVLPTPDLVAHAQELLQHLHGGQGARFVLRDLQADYQMILSEQLYDLLRQVLIDLSQNRAVQVLPHAMELTTVQAAEFLQVSRPHLIKLIEDGKIPCRKVGTHRRIRLNDLINYRHGVDAESRMAREEMTREAEKLGWGY